MQELDDNALLREYLARGSDEAFAALVTRHVHKVYSVALRHTGNPHSAGEITQAVFVILARKSRHLGRRVILSGWLYQTARLTAVTFIRSEIRRVRREQEAQMQTALNENESNLWTQIAPLLDAAMAGLNETDRTAVVLRFFDGKSMAEIGAALGANENAAKKRVNRAVEKLRKYFSKRGVTSTAETLAGTISANSVQTAPALLAKTATAVALAKGAAASTSTLTLIKGALKIMAWTKAKMAIVVGAASLFVVVITSITVTMIYPGEPRYQGKLLSEWLKQYQSISETTPPITSNEMDRRLAMQKRLAMQNQAEEAVRHIGVKALPTLLKWANTTNAIGREEPSVFGYTLGRIGFLVLGPIAKSAVPTLTEILTNEDFNLRGDALLDLGEIGTNAADALPAVIEHLKNDQVYFIRDWAAAVIGDIGTNDPERIVPVLIESLNATNDSAMHANSLESLAKFGEQAKAAIPFIVPYLKDANSEVSTAAAYALRQIDREAAAAAGVQLRQRRAVQRPAVQP